MIHQIVNEMLWLRRKYYGGYVQMFLPLKNGFINGLLKKKVLICDSGTIFN